jgi:AcrR family transcriptional regulator
MVNDPALHPYSTENRILEAAKKVFIQNGLEGTTMQQIADEAGINKSLLHYYFRSKDRLFDAVFGYAIQHVVPRLENIMNDDEHIFRKIERLVAEYMNMLMENKFIPAFVLHEINRNPDRIFQTFKNSGINPEIFISRFMEEMRKGTIRETDPRQLFISILSLCIFPIAARPLMQRIFFGNNDLVYDQFLDARKKVVADIIIKSIKN